MKNFKSWVVDPANFIFKEFQNNPAKGFILKCESPESCELFKNNQCVLKENRCPYGTKEITVGPTKRSKKYYTWLTEFKVNNSDTLNVVINQPKKLAYFKDLVYIPIAHLNLNKNIDFVDGGGWSFNIGRPIIKKEIFDNAEFISKEIINFQPRSILDNCVIEKYQAQEVPKFLIWLKQLNPDLFNEVKKLNQDNKVFENLSNIGRQAKLVTLTPNVSKFVDIHGGIWVWDGEYIVSKNSKVSFTLVESKDTEECKLKPNKNAVVKITDENQVNENTIFIS